MFMPVMTSPKSKLQTASESAGMKRAHFHRMLAAAFAPIGTLLVAFPATADLILNFDNGRPDASSVPAYITFTGAAPGQFDATVAGTSTPLQEGVSYSLSTLAAGVDVTEYKSGRVFVSLGAGLTGLSPSNDYAPNFLNPNGPNFTTRMDKYEITYNGSTGGANLSSTDFFGIPLELKTTGGSQPTTLTWNYNGAVNTATVFQNLAALEGYLTDTSSNTLGALVANGADGVTIDTPGGPLTGVVRIIAPSTTNGGTTPYPGFDNYLTYLETGGTGSTPIHADIAGQNGQYPKSGPFQNYTCPARSTWKPSKSSSTRMRTCATRSARTRRSSTSTPSIRPTRPSPLDAGCRADSAARFPRRPGATG